MTTDTRKTGKTGNESKVKSMSKKELKSTRGGIIINSMGSPLRRLNKAASPMLA
mgnify:CR=1 FL=1